MAVVNDLEKIVAWLQENVCAGYKLKMPDDRTPGEKYQYKLVEPTAWPLYIPTAERMPKTVVAPYPCILVRIVQGEEFPKEGTETLDIILNFVIWNPGQHGPDVFTTNDGENYQQQCLEAFVRNMDGWKDTWSFIDRTARIIRGAEYIAGMRVLTEKGLKYGPANEADTLNEMYPYWAAYLQFSLSRGCTPAHFDDLL